MTTIFGETPVARRLKANSIVLVEDMAGIILQGVSMAGTPRRPEGKGTICLQMLRIFSWREDLPRGGGRHSNAIEDMRQRERERARQRASKRLGGPGVNRSGKPTLQNSSSPVRQQKARDFSRPRQNLRFSAMSNSSNVSFGMDDGNEVSHFDPFEDDDLEEEELPSKSSLRRGNSCVK